MVESKTKHNHDSRNKKAHLKSELKQENQYFSLTTNAIFPN